MEFIKLKIKSKDEFILINIKRIDCIIGSIIYFSGYKDNYVIVVESFEEIEQLIKQATEL